MRMKTRVMSKMSLMEMINDDGVVDDDGDGDGDSPFAFNIVTRMTNDALNPTPNP